MKITIKHQILKKLREDRHIPFEAMPEKLSLDRSEYEKLEREDKLIDIKIADRIAAVFKRNWSVFLLNEAPEKVSIKNDNRTFENRTPTLHEETIEAIEDANFILDFSKDLTSRPKLEVPIVKKIAHFNAEELGSLVRKQSGIDVEKQSNFKSISKAFNTWLAFVESKGIYVSQYPFNEGDKVRAFSISKNDQAIIVLNTRDSQAARIFSLIHELCHIIRRTAGFCDLHHSQTSGVEVFCNKFAASFLVPSEFMDTYLSGRTKHELRQNLDSFVRKIAYQLSVSRLMVYRKFATLQIITDQEYSHIHQNYLKDLSKKPGEKFSRKEDKGGPDYYIIKTLRNGIAYSSSVLEAFSTGEITQFEASNALGVKPRYLESYNKSAPLQIRWSR